MERKFGLSGSGAGKGRTSRTVSLSPTRRREGSRGRSTSAAPTVPRLTVTSRSAAAAPRPTLLNAQDLPDVLNTIERWIASRGTKGPAERDSKKVEAYLVKLIDVDQGLGGIEMAVECLKWMRLILVERHGSDHVAEGEHSAGKQWWSTWERFKSNVSQRVLDALGAPLIL